MKKYLSVIIVLLLIALGSAAYYYHHNEVISNNKIEQSEDIIIDLKNENTNLRAEIAKDKAAADALRKANLEAQKKVGELTTVITQKEADYKELKKHLKPAILGNTYTDTDYLNCINVVNACEEKDKAKDEKISLLESTLSLYEREREALWKALNDSGTIIGNQDTILNEKDKIIAEYKGKSKQGKLSKFLNRYVKYPAIIGFSVYAGYKAHSDNKIININ